MAVAKLRLWDGSVLCCSWVTPSSSKRRWTRFARSMVVVDVDAHGLVVGHALVGDVGDGAPVEPLEQGDHLVAPRLHPGRSPGTAPAVATSVTRSPSRTPWVRNSATAPLARRAVAGVRWMSSNNTTKVRPRVSSLLLVRGDPGSRAGHGGRRGRDVDGLEAHHRLSHAVLEDLEVLLAEPAQGDALLVRDHDVHRDLLDLAGKLGCLLRAGGAASWPRTIDAPRGKAREKVLLSMLVHHREAESTSAAPARPFAGDIASHPTSSLTDLHGLG